MARSGSLSVRSSASRTGRAGTTVANMEKANMKVAIIGCGPAGLAAAHAAYGLGAEVTIFSPGIKSPQRGPLVLQRPIPGVTNDHPDSYIRQIVIGGSILDYRYKLYGDINISINGNILKAGYHCWNHIETYDTLWLMYMGEHNNGRVGRVDGMVRPTLLMSMIVHRDYDLIINTAPLIDICGYPSHEFRFHPVQITMGHSYPDQPEDTTIFNAGDEFPWVRSAWLLGNRCTEWIAGTAPEELDPITIRKPLGHNCNCYPTVLGTGRFGAWRNETWVDTAYWDTRDAIISMQRGKIWDQVK
ncbi:MAG TPA: hypothetical protein VNS88_03260 [Nitrospiraceae bacterium]|nr:hypothetical protein [Nitrospiraceae bacterium]